ncbi:uncharacterized protein LOC112521044 [Cynara cardunculus var. scolymus]|uniref:uncharacterized protein LOC112521044 n=1 Tax=Cynara cardunculus var. scolymus TaxID=59895 RepID=UPI000D62632B|nr:uncharacterized protein LOC112521044 [Cynara cardunculus var. scolymus]
MSSQEEGKTVCVTGASGYIASWLVKLLLHRGYTVNATVRDLNDPKKTEHLLALDGAKERLHLFQADLLMDGSFDAVVQGCDGVFHTASPFFITTNNPQEELIDPAVKGTLNVLSSCSKVPSIKRVVLTSSVAAVLYNGSPLTPKVVVDESWFSDQGICKESKLWYPLSKTLAEEAAWKYAEEKGMDMVTINPAMVIGPLLQPTLNTSARAIFSLINAPTYRNITVGCVHITDVAIAHILAFETPSASGRYCMAESVVHFSELVQILHKLYPSFKLPNTCEDDAPIVKYQFSKERAKCLGIKYTPLEEGIKETIESLKEKKFLKTELIVPEKMSGAGKTVCVTGGSGYIASCLVKLLLERGYSVKASVRYPNNPTKTDHLLKLDGAKERLHLFKADLLQDGSFDDAVDGCDGVFHTASPFFTAVTDPQTELIEPALKGTLNVLASCSKASSVKRVVVTSSMAAVEATGRPKTPETVVDETWFSDPDLCKEMKLWYVLSKTLAEEAAWKFAKEKGMDIVTINPAMVIGTLLQSNLNTSAEAIARLLNGSETYLNSSLGWVNVKDVANAHIQAFEIPSASGRYCLVERVVHYSELIAILRKLYPSCQLPEKCADDNPFAPTFQVSKEKAKSLGIDYIPIEQSIKETVESLKDKNFVKL